MRSQQEIQTELLNNGWQKSNEQVWVKSEQFDPNDISWPIDSYDQNEYQENYWSKSRADLINKTCKNLGINQLLEIGSGHGNVAIPLTKSGIEITALEPILSGAIQTAEKGITTINGSLDSISQVNLTFPAIGVFDVLEHTKEPIQFLGKLRNKLSEGGVVIVTVPSHNWLFSDFDIAIGHFKRYTKKKLRNEMQEAGYQEIFSRYFFVSLVPIAFLFRRIPYLLGRRRDFTGKSGVKEGIVKATRLNKVLDSVLYRILKVDSKLKLSVGLSLLAVYKKSQKLPL